MAEASAPRGPSSPPVDHPRTLPDLPAWTRRFRKPAVIRRCRAAGFETLSADDLVERVRALALGLESMGIAAGDRVAIQSESRPEWVLADLAILSLGAITVPIYPTLPSAAVRLILADSGARLAVVSDVEQRRKVQDVRHVLPGLEAIVEIAPGLAVDEETKGTGTTGSVMTLAAVEARGRARLTVDPDLGRLHEDRIARLSPTDPATIIYTSGTTGEPKGVVLSHDNILSNIRASTKVVHTTVEDEGLSFLPLSHSFERLVAFWYLHNGVTLTFAESLDTIARDLSRVKPTVITGVPRVYEKLRARVLERVAASPAARRRLFAWAIRVGSQVVGARREGRSVSLGLSLKARVADLLVARRVRERLGGRLRLAVSGSAPLPQDVGEFFEALSMPIVEGYGLTETSPILTVNPEHAIRYGTVGKAVPGVEIRLADDGEVLARGPNVMLGYYNRPEETAAVLLDGWLHTGDIGEIDTDGYLTITDRKKDLIVTSGGKNVAPGGIEQRLKSSPLVVEALVIGDGRRFPAALIVPDFDALLSRLRALGRPGGGTREELTARADVQALYQELVDGVNGELASFERLKRFALVPAELSIAGGELTPTMKLRRGVVESRWRDVIEELYAESGNGPR